MQKSFTGGTYGGSVSMDISGNACATGTFYDKIYDPFGDSGHPYYRLQISTLCHEIGHIFGCSIGELYSLAIANDLSGIEPIYNLDYTNPDDIFWQKHKDWITDPMFGRWRQFSALNKKIIAGFYRFGLNNIPLSDYTKIKLKVVDTNNVSVVNANITIWKDIEFNFGVLTNGTTDSSGQFVFHYGSQSYDHMFTDNLRLILVEYKGEKQKRWISIFESEEMKLLNNEDEWIVPFKLNSVAEIPVYVPPVIVTNTLPIPDPDRTNIVVITNVTTLTNIVNVTNNVSAAGTPYYDKLSSIDNSLQSIDATLKSMNNLMLWGAKRYLGYR